MPHRTFLALGLLGLASLGACSGGGGPGGAAKTVRPDAPTYASTTSSDTKCTEVPGQGEPFVVDWPPEKRADLEAAMREGIAIVSYDCKTVRLLKDCSSLGSYGFVGITRKEQVVKLADSDELKVHLPFSGVALAAKLGGELQRGASLDIALVMVGKQSTTTPAVARPELMGSCEGASHFVRRAVVGAFAMRVGSKAELRAAAEVFGAKAEGASQSARDVANADGDLGACKAANPSVKEAPAQCGAPLRIELYPLVDKAQAKAAAPAKPDPSKPDPEDDISVCPDHHYLVKGVCTHVGEHQASAKCDRNKQADCEARCAKDEAESCYELGYIYRDVVKDFPKSRATLMKACKLGSHYGCSSLASDLISMGTVQDPAGALEAARIGCDAGSPSVCDMLGKALIEGRNTKRDPVAGAEALKRACFAGIQWSCQQVAPYFDQGKDGVARDEFTARRAYALACGSFSNTTYLASCAGWGLMTAEGRGGKADKAKGAAILRRVCSFPKPEDPYAPALNTAPGCEGLKKLGEQP